MIKIGIIGGAGYTAGELIRLLINHPEAEIVFINSGSNAGNRVTDVHEGLYGETDLRFTDRLPLDETSTKASTARRTCASPTGCPWTRLTASSSAPPTATRASSWTATTCRKG